MAEFSLNTLTKKGSCSEEFDSLRSKNKYVETRIATKYGEFFTRVYRSLESKETVVLWSGKFSDENPPLVRVHSECFTGDIIGSLKCDCGEQLQRSMRLVQQHGGILIYLRQEGRGIGLFEKIKAYELQSKGYDTFEANAILGHVPDARTYEMVKVILDDFPISRIRLLTNNPSKVSEIAKYKIEIIERVPILIQPNKHNRKYFEAKKKKFHHNFSDNQKTYYYGCSIDSSNEFNKLIDRFPMQFNDPFLTLSIGVNANHKSLGSKKERNRVEGIYKAIKDHKKIVFVLHFSFKTSDEPAKQLQLIREALPFVKCLQLNDVNSLNYSFLKKAFSLFQVYLPLSDANFRILRISEIRNLIKVNSGIILLDNSKGTGKIETFDTYREKIDQLFEWGLERVALCGGFGPDELQIYYSLRHYYRVNFSIDAETKLRKANKVDIDLTAKYLGQLLESTTPSAFGIAQTRAFLKKHNRAKWDIIDIKGKNFYIHPKVFHAGKFPSSLWYAEIIAKRVAQEQDFCEVGCGAGLTSCLVASHNPSIMVVATDINPYAGENTKKNAISLNISNRVRSICGDVLDGLNNKDQFETIFWALPFGFLDPGTQLNLEEMQVFDPGYRAIRKFFKTAKSHLKPGGKLLIGFSAELGDVHLLHKFASEFNLKLSRENTAVLKEEKEIEFELLGGVYIS
jgi:GTP cyclohydrolase II